MSAKIRIHSIVNVLFIAYYFSLLVFVSKPETLKYSKILFVLFMLSMIGNLIISNQTISIRKPLRIYGPFFIFCMFSIIWAVDRTQALTTTITLAQMFVLLVFTYSYYSIYEDVDFLIWAIVICGVLMSVYCIWYYGIDAYITAITVKGRLGNDISNANTIATNAAISTIGCVYYALYKKKYVYYPLAALCVIVILGSSSRTGFLITVIGCLMLVLIKTVEVKNIVKTFVKLLIATFFVVLIFNIVMRFLPDASIFSRLETMFAFFSDNGGRVDSSTLERMAMIELGKNIFKSSPLIGIGVDNARVVAMQSGFWNTYLHNNFIELLADVGIIGFLLFYRFYYYFFSRTIKLYPKLNVIRENHGWFILIAVILLCKFVMDYAGITYYAQSFYVLYAVGLLAIDKINKELEYDEECIRS